MRRIFSLLLLVVATVPVLTGCLPSNQRKTSQALFPSDSLSRRIAEAAPVDTLARVWRAEAPAEAVLAYPTGLGLAGSGRVVVVDSRRGAVHFFGEDGRWRSQVADERFAYPFLAGAHGDTVAVINRGTNRLDLVVGDRVVRRVEGPPGQNPVALLTSGGFYFKTTGKNAGPVLRRLDADGREVARYALDGPWWRHFGFLRTWGDTLVSLSGYRPVIDVLPPGAAAGTVLDTLALVGFDSPQLARSRLFAEGEVDEPPLLSPAAAAAGDRLFVLNARPGWAQIDVFRRAPEGLRLERVLVEPTPAFRDDFFAADLAVRATGAGFELFVLEAQPVPAVVLYRWQPEAAPPVAAQGVGEEQP